MTEFLFFFEKEGKAPKMVSPNDRIYLLRSFIFKAHLAL